MLVVAGTNAIYGYEAAAGVHVGGEYLATGDLDILLDARAKLKLTLDGDEPRPIIDVLKAADTSFRQMEEPHRAVNRDGFSWNSSSQRHGRPGRTSGTASATAIGKRR